MPTSTVRWRTANGRQRSIRRSSWLLLCFTTYACSLVAPSDDELFLDAERVGNGGVGGAGNGAGGSGSGDGDGAIDLSTPPALGGSGGAAPSDDFEPPASPPDAGVAAPPSCVDCESVRFTGASATLLFGSPGGSLNVDICPHDQVVVGMDYEFTFGTPADFGYLTSLALVCGALTPRQSTGSVDVVIGEPLIPRGAGAGARGMGGRCPPGEVVTAFEGARNFDGTTSELRELTLHCAPLSLGADRSVAIGTARPASPLSADFAVSTLPADEILPPQLCPPGQVARGAVVRAGAWVDAVALVCSTPVLARADGQACSSAIECQSGSCNGTCQPRPCTPPAGCACALLENTQHAFCPAAQTQAGAAAACESAGMYLAYAEDPLTHGWLRSTAGRERIQATFWLGADDLASEGDFQWVRGGGAVDLASELWATDEQRGGTLENCLVMTRNGHWDDADCALTLPFVCAAPPP